jgi:hypothetical protein
MEDFLEQNQGFESFKSFEICGLNIAISSSMYQKNVTEVEILKWPISLTDFAESAVF